MSATTPGSDIDPWGEVLGPSTIADIQEGLDASVDELVEQLEERARPTKPGKGDPHANNPSKTTTIQRKYAQKLRGRFAKIATEVRRGVRDRDVLGLESDNDGQETSASDLLADAGVPEEVRDRLVKLLGAERYDDVKDLGEQLADDYDPDDLVSRDFQFSELSRKHQEFMRWLRAQQAQGVLEVIGREDNPYVRSAYERGWKNAGTWMEPDPVAPDVMAALQRPVHQDKLQLLYSRNFEALQGITEEVSRQISRELASGLAEGVHPDQMASRITDRIDKIGKTRATTLARTEVMYAHNESIITTYERAMGDVEVDVVAEVSTAQDMHVCEICDPWHGTTMSLEDARSEGPPLHPRCRCVVVPAVEKHQGNLPAGVKSGS